MWGCEESLLEAGLGPKNAVHTLSMRYENYVRAYNEDPKVCGREKLLLSQAASYLDGVVSIRIEGIVMTLVLGSHRKIVIPASQFYE